ncbi:hypothetical protein [Salinicola tamaricis]|uniref:hypothetical protein n=1 Tax=Salinicola tamaricis TaxID=1771309 RepID=UPI0013ECBA78|nr:hypothetical protein [Salinicola tamaricis]
MSESSAGPMEQWLDQQQAPRVTTQNAWRVVKGDDGHGYLLTLVPLSQVGDAMQRP